MIFPIPSQFNNQSLRAFFTHHHLGRVSSYNLEQAKALFINGSQATLESILHTNDELLILFEAIDKPTHEAVHQPINIVYEDRDLVVVEKEAGILVHSDGNQGITLSNIVQAHYHETGIVTRCLHRLDLETTGMVLFSKHLLAHASFTHLFESHQMKKEYVCLCEGKFPSASGVINSPIGRNRHENAQIVSKTGKSALTFYCVESYNHSISRLRVEIEGGRRHQIRVHLSSIGHPIVGDTLYGAKHPAPLKLHFEKITFTHPFTGEVVSVYLPSSF